MSSTHPVDLTAYLVGVVTVLYNSESVLPGFFESLARERTARFRLYVVDNSPTSSGVELARALAVERGIDAVFVRNPENAGIAKANNQGVALARADQCQFVLLTNNDIEFPAGVIPQLIQDCVQLGVSAATPKIYYHGTRNLLWYAGGRITRWLMLVEHFGMGQTDRGQFEEAGSVEFAPACFLLLRTDIFSAVGALDEQFFVYYEDTDFMWRMRAHGLRVAYDPAAVVEHKVSTLTGGAKSPFSLYYLNRNRIYFIRKHTHGFKKFVALTFALGTRVVRTAMYPHREGSHVWRGVRDGFRIPISS